MRLLILVVLAAPALDCVHSKRAEPVAVSVAAVPVADAEELAKIDAAIAAAGEHPTGDSAARLFERRGDLLLAMKRSGDAKAAYLEAARCYAQSPEASNGPVERSDRMRKKAEAIGP